MKRKSGNLDPSLKAELRNLRNELCVSGDTKLDWRNFLAATMDKNLALREDKIRLAFDQFRQSGSYVEVSDLTRIFGSHAQAMEIMGSADVDKDGRIDYMEFKNVMESNMNMDTS